MHLIKWNKNFSYFNSCEKNIYLKWTGGQLKCLNFQFALSHPIHNGSINISESVLLTLWLHCLLFLFIRRSAQQERFIFWMESYFVIVLALFSPTWMSDVMLETLNKIIVNLNHNGVFVLRQRQTVNRQIKSCINI